MNTFNVVAGLVTISSFIFAIVVYMQGKQKEVVEAQKHEGDTEKLRTVFEVSEAVERQIHLVAQMADRQKTTNAELKHLAVSAIYSVNVIQTIIKKSILEKRAWVFGVPDHYMFIQSDADALEKTSAEEDNESVAGATDHPSAEKNGVAKNVQPTQ